MLCVNNTTEGVSENMGVVPIVVPPFQFFKVAVQMLHAHLVERSDDAPLEQRPDAFDAVGINVAQDPLLDGVVDGLMAGVVVSNAQVGRQFVSVDSLRLVVDRPIDKVVKGMAPHVGDALQANVAVPLDGSGDPGLVTLVGPSFALSLTTNQGFVYFNDSQEGRPIKGVVAHCLTDAMAKIPRGLVGYAQCPLELKSAYALLGFAHQVYCQEPLPQGKMGIVHDGSYRYGELVATIIAVVLVSRLYFRYAHGPTADADHAAWPAQAFQQLPAFGIGAVIVNQG